MDAALATAAADLATATTVCAATPPTPSTCADAQALVLTDETTVQRLQQLVASQESQLDRLLSTAAKQTSASSRSGSGSTSGSSSGGSTVSAARLAADQAAVDAAEADVALARQNLHQAVVTSPIAGVVSSVGLTVGSTATAGSSSSAIGVVDPTTHTVSVPVDVAKVPLVKVGQQATVVPDGTGSQLPATVSYVAPAPSTAGGSSYLVRLTFAGSPTGLYDGVQAAVSIAVAGATGLAVPTSAVGHLGSISYVQVVDGTTTRRTLVTVGAVGAEYTQVTQGLTAGQQVVLANVDEPIPTSTLTGRFGRFAGAGGLGGLGGTGGFVTAPGPGRD